MHFACNGLSVITPQMCILRACAESTPSSGSGCSVPCSIRCLLSSKRSQVDLQEYNLSDWDGVCAHIADVYCVVSPKPCHLRQQKPAQSSPFALTRLGYRPPTVHATAPASISNPGYIGVHHYCAHLCDLRTLMSETDVLTGKSSRLLSGEIGEPEAAHGLVAGLEAGHSKSSAVW